MVQNSVTLRVQVGKWRAKLAFHMVNHGSYPILGHPGLIQLNLIVDCVRKNLVGDDGDTVYVRYLRKTRVDLYTAQDVQYKKCM